MSNTTRTGSITHDGEVSTHFNECTGKRQPGNGCMSLKPTWLRKKIPKASINRSFLCVPLQQLKWLSSNQNIQQFLTSHRSVESCRVSFLLIQNSMEEGTTYKYLGYWGKKIRNKDVYAVINVAQKRRKSSIRSGHPHLSQSA